VVSSLEAVSVEAGLSRGVKMALQMVSKSSGGEGMSSEGLFVVNIVSVKVKICEVLVEEVSE
jgi:hypothetical protein